MVQELMGFIRSYVVPEGFPDSVIPSYVPYMTWRALKVCVCLSRGWVRVRVCLGFYGEGQYT